MAKYYAPNFSGLLPLFDGKSAAGGKLYAYRAGSSIPAPLFDEDGVELGSWVSIDSNGCADFLLDSSLSYKLVVKDSLGAVVGEWDNVKATNAPGGMDNPMTAPGDLIVGGTGGTATALPAGNDDQMLSPYTENGVKKLKWKNVPAQPGDHKTAVDAADASPDYLAAKLAAGSGISLTNTGSAVEIAATAQTGDHQLLVSATDAAAGYLGAKLTAGSNVTLTTQTDGDGVQTLEISATGGGGGGGGSDWSYLSNFSNHYVQSTNAYFQLYFSFNPLGPTVRSILIPYGDYAPNKAVNVKIAIWKVPNLNSPSLGTPYAEKSFSGVSVKQPLTWFDFDADVDVSDKTVCYVFAFSTTTTNTGFNPRLLLSDSGGASYNFMFASYQMKANDAWVSNYPAFVSGNNTNAFGLSSRAMNS